MTSIKICKKLREVSEMVKELYTSINSLEHSDKIAAIDKVIEGINEYRKRLNSDNSSWRLLELFPQVADCLKEAKSTLESEGTGGYRASVSIDHAITLIDGIRVYECPNDIDDIHVIQKAIVRMRFDATVARRRCFEST